MSKNAMFCCTDFKNDFSLYPEMKELITYWIIHLLKGKREPDHSVYPSETLRKG